MSLQKLIGDDQSGYNPTGSASYFRHRKFTANATGVVKQLAFYSHTTDGVKVSIYDSSGNLLSSNDSNISCNAGEWNYIDIDDVLVTVSTVYDLAFVNEAFNQASADDYDTLGNSGYRAVTFSSFTAPDPIGSFSSSDAGYAINAWGYIPPSITDAEDENLDYNETDFNISGADFEDLQGNGNVWITNNATWGSETIKVAQTINSWADGTINIDCIPGTLSSGTVYIQIETDSGQIPSSGYAINFTASTSGWSNIAKVRGVSQANVAKVAGVSKANIAKINGVSV